MQFEVLCNLNLKFSARGYFQSYSFQLESRAADCISPYASQAKQQPKIHFLCVSLILFACACVFSSFFRWIFGFSIALGRYREGFKVVSAKF